MPRKAKSVTSPTTDTSIDQAPVKKTPVKRVENVRDIILRVLSAGPLTRPEISAQGKFSEAALYNNLKVLRDLGLIEIDSDPKKLRIVSGATPAPVTVKAAKKASVKKVAAKKTAMKKTATKKAVAKKATVQKAAVKKRVAKAPLKAAAGKKSARVISDLHSALSMMESRLSPIERIEEKLTVLEQLAKTTPKLIADLLLMLKADIMKLASFK